jgi:hypothetical protein
MGQHWSLKFDEQKLRQLLRESSLRSKFYAVVREELKRIGRWRNRPRGRSAKHGKA